MNEAEIAYTTCQDPKTIEYVDVKTYPSGEPMVKHERTGLPFRVLLRPNSAAGFLGGIFWVQSLVEQGAPAPELICPMVFGSRQDRINPQGDVLFTIKSVARLINSLGCPRVIVFDPHSEATPAAIDRCKVVNTDDIVAIDSMVDYQSGWEPFPEYSAIVSPDAGAEKRAGRLAKLWGIPLKRGWKTRDVKDGKITGFGVEPLNDLSDENGRPRVLVVDDICDGGGTFVGLADCLDREKVLADLSVTHGVFSKGTAGLLERFNRIFCTDSVVAQRPDVEVITACEYILKNGANL